MLLFVASEAREFSGVLKHVRGARPAALAVDWSRVGTLAGSKVLLVANGVGVKRAAAAVDRAVERYRPRALISTGFCGALDEKLRIADIVQGYEGRIHTADHVVTTAAEKAALRATGAIAVEMEAAGVAARAADLGVPFHCVKSVTDLAGETLVNDFNKALRPDGHFDTINILRESLRRPTERLPELLRLRNRCARAARALGDFFADCRF
jgi:nucleoside phosphorylase